MIGEIKEKEVFQDTKAHNLIDQFHESWNLNGLCNVYIFTLFDVNGKSLCVSSFYFQGGVDCISWVMYESGTVVEDVNGVITLEGFL